MPELTKRKPIRLKNHDYSLNGYYFITICSKDRQNIFGEIVNDEKSVGANGRWPVSNGIKIKLDRYIIMPNHLHCIIIINHNLTGGQPSAPTGNINRKHTLSSFVSGFKSIVTKRVNILLNTPRKPVWQRSFYDHIIRNDRSLNAIREYISNNPVNWQLDIDNLINL